MRCGVCGRENSDGWSYCGYCGSPLQEKRPLMRKHERGTAAVILIVAIAVVIVLTVAIQAFHDADPHETPPDPQSEVWLSEGLLVTGDLADGTFTVSPHGDRLEVVFNEFDVGDNLYIWVLREGQDELDRWVEMSPRTFVDIGDLPPGEYALELVTGVQEASGTLVICADPQPDVQWD